MGRQGYVRQTTVWKDGGRPPARMSSGNGRIKCWRCGKTGHISMDCHGWRRVVRCWTCERTGHMSRDCWLSKRNVAGGSALMQREHRSEDNEGPRGMKRELERVTANDKEVSAISNGSVNSSPGLSGGAVKMRRVGVTDERRLAADAARVERKLWENGSGKRDLRIKETGNRERRLDELDERRRRVQWLRNRRRPESQVWEYNGGERYKGEWSHGPRRRDGWSSILQRLDWMVDGLIGVERGLRGKPGISH